MAVNVGQLQSGTRIWCLIEDVTVRAKGTVAPCLDMSLHVRATTPGDVVELHCVEVSLWHGEELMGTGLTIGQTVGSQTGSTVSVMLPTTHRVLNHVTDVLPASATDVDLQLRCRGQLVVTCAENGRQRFHGDPEPGVPTPVMLNDHASSQVRLPRTSWHTQVLEAVRGQGTLFLEVAVLRGSLSDSTGWNAANAHLDGARRRYALGDYPGVFSDLRGALDALPGSKKAIFDDLPDHVRRPMDELTKSIGVFFHTGRHVAEDGDVRGQFPVDVHTARLALDLATVLFGHISTIKVAYRP